jgi:cytidylate kinase
MPLITITQDYGCDGMEVAEKVAEKLGLNLFDDQKLHALIQKRGITPEEVGRLDEKAPGYWDFFFRSRPQVFLNILESVVYDVARTGEGVIVGHGSQVLLRNFDCAFHVRLFASAERRAEMLGLRQGLGREAALKLVRQRDRELAGFLKFAFRIDLEDPALYDLIIHTHKLDATAAADLIIAAERSESMRVCSLGALESMERLGLEKTIRAALIEHRIDPGQIIVEVAEKGVAHVGGIIASAEEKQRIEATVGGVPGVAKVVSRVEVVRGGI